MTGSLMSRRSSVGLECVFIKGMMPCEWKQGSPHYLLFGLGFTVHSRP